MAEVQQIQFRSAQTPLGELATLPQTFYSAGEGATPPRLLSPSTPTAPRSLVRVHQFFFHNLSTGYWYEVPGRRCRCWLCWCCSLVLHTAASTQQSEHTSTLNDWSYSCIARLWVAGQ